MIRTAAKRRNLAWLALLAAVVLASWLQSGASALASSHTPLSQKLRAELFAEDGQFSIGPSLVSPETAPSYYDPFEEVALESSVAPKGPRPNGGFSGHKGFELKNHPGQVVRNQPATINGRSFSGHALDQMQNRGIPPSVVDNAIKNGQRFVGKRPNTQGFFDPVNRIRVIVNSETGNIITVIPGGG